MDSKLRELERAAALGDPEAAAQFFALEAKIENFIRFSDLPINKSFIFHPQHLLKSYTKNTVFTKLNNSGYRRLSGSDRYQLYQHQLDTTFVKQVSMLYFRRQYFGSEKFYNA